jgi:hypothetical protein
MSDPHSGDPCLLFSATHLSLRLEVKHEMQNRKVSATEEVHLMPSDSFEWKLHITLPSTPSRHLLQSIFTLGFPAWTPSLVSIPRLLSGCPQKANFF